MNLKFLLFFILLFSACSKDHKNSGTSSNASAPVQEGDGVQNGGGTYQFYAYSNPLFLLQAALMGPDIFNYFFDLDITQQIPYDDNHEKIWIKNFQKFEQIGFSILAEVNNTRDWTKYSDIEVPLVVTSHLYDPKTGAPLMATNFTKPAQIFLAPHVWVDNPNANIVPCNESLYDLKTCQEAQLATIAVHEKLGCLGFVEEATGRYQFSSLVYRRMMGQHIEE